MKTVILNGKVVTEDAVIDHCDVVLSGRTIEKVGKASGADLKNAEIYDAEGKYVMPGLIDIHSDMIENLIQPRSTAVMDFNLAIEEAERLLTGCGITTMFHSISMYRDGTWDVKEIRKASQVKKLAALVKQIQSGQRMIHHRYHLRYEIDNLDCYDDVLQMIEGGLVDLLSFMDHTPGQGQYKNLEIYKKHQPDEGKSLDDQAFEKLVYDEQHKAVADFDQLKRLADAAGERHISVSSHDDDTVEKLAVNEALGVAISEFPITLETAKAAGDKGFLTVLGAPNILLGGSHSGNLSALDAINAGAASILVSDYYPQALIQAVFYLVNQCHKDMAQMVRLVSINPARATGIDDVTGSIAAGKCGDILIVGDRDGRPFIEHVFADGQCVGSFSLRKEN